MGNGPTSQEGLRPAEVEAVLRRALEIDVVRAGARRVAEEDLYNLGSELGVSADAVEEAIGEWRTGRLAGEDHGWAERLLGPGGVVVRGRSTRDPERVSAAAHRYLSGRGMVVDQGGGAGSVWRQRNGWWPDLQRMSAVTRLTVSVTADGSVTELRVDADMRSARFGHGSLGTAGAVWTIVALATGGPSALIAALGGVALAAWAPAGYRRRLRGVEERLEVFCESVLG